MENTERRDRQRIITEIVARWVSKNPELVKTFSDSVKEMRQGVAQENQAMSYKATIPGDLFRQLDFAISGDGEPRLFDPDGELKWFAENYPEFVVPYDRSTLER